MSFRGDRSTQRSGVVGVCTAPSRVVPENSGCFREVRASTAERQTGERGRARGAHVMPAHVSTVARGGRPGHRWGVVGRTRRALCVTRPPVSR